MERKLTMPWMRACGWSSKSHIIEVLIESCDVRVLILPNNDSVGPNHPPLDKVSDSNLIKGLEESNRFLETEQSKHNTLRLLSLSSTSSLAWLSASSSFLQRRKYGQQITLTFQEFCGNFSNSNSLSDNILLPELQPMDGILTPSLQYFFCIQQLLLTYPLFRCINEIHIEAASLSIILLCQQPTLFHIVFISIGATVTDSPAGHSYHFGAFNDELAWPQNLQAPYFEHCVCIFNIHRRKLNDHSIIITRGETSPVTASSSLLVVSFPSQDNVDSANHDDFFTVVLHQNKKPRGELMKLDATNIFQQ
ncbi:hypothetical protein VNO77_33817 [Canavalia gladiata]|uniref:Uncharacterized protein n=1 Tax=Canavalia gladiata TaxID=3824 RepID=A0AAN9KEY0_CANGL